MADSSSESIDKQGPMKLALYMLQKGHKPPGQPRHKESEPTGSNQANFAIGVGYATHHYLSHRDPSDPHKEWVMQVVASYTRQFHKQNVHGIELSAVVQGQQSLTTGTPSFGTGFQAAYVQPLLHNKLQLSWFFQTLLVVPITAPTHSGAQFQPASFGGSIMYQPKDWLLLGAQASGGLTVQKRAPYSFDGGYMAFIQVNFP